LLHIVVVLVNSAKIQIVDLFWSNFYCEMLVWLPADGSRCSVQSSPAQ